MDTLYIDMGNSRAKWWLSSANARRGQLDYSSLSEGVEAIHRQAPTVEKVVLASVLSVEKTKDVVSRLQTCFAVPIKQCVVTRKALGVTCGYEDLTKLGVDRWLVVIAVWQRYKFACQVVDLGTAMTIDLLDAKGNHLGGFIVSGLGLSIEGLLAGTDNIRSDVGLFDHATLQPGVNTTEAVYHGALLGAVSLIETSFENATRCNSDTKLILVGGDAHLVGDHLRYDFEILEDLVYEGMRLLDNSNLLIDAVPASE
ncbi:type III pantothenate kinase [Ketobacter sp. MCCC 1A13808]|uniref:type III pantothenate kinase n=1 Tax=Ketobacter sp. MCCC 1A13808 TaxID=2602738 RepID=UPI0012EB6691|nr:type III pantothenate kinase [Ketobacter sp. MCCC 1A13808]MVF14952.1 type III pantothenate kinase [Ketobacter sp. MCCC 1A13808]